MEGKAIVLKVDTEKNPQLAARFNVQAIPNFVILSGGRVVKQQAGVVSHDQLDPRIAIERWQGVPLMMETSYAASLGP
jgi:thioredoxin-like negative regulator of GroEL